MAGYRLSNPFFILSWKHCYLGNYNHLKIKTSNSVDPAYRNSLYNCIQLQNIRLYINIYEQIYKMYYVCFTRKVYIWVLLIKIYQVCVENKSILALSEIKNKNVFNFRNFNSVPV